MFYTIGNVLLTTRQVELIRKKEFAVAVLDPEHKVFDVYMAALNVDLGDKVDPSRKTQIVYLKADEALTKVSSKYTDFTDVFLLKLAAELSDTESTIMPSS